MKLSLILKMTSALLLVGTTAANASTNPTITLEAALLSGECPNPHSGIVLGCDNYCQEVTEYTTSTIWNNQSSAIWLACQAAENKEYQQTLNLIKAGNFPYSEQLRLVNQLCLLSYASDNVITDISSHLVNQITNSDSITAAQNLAFLAGFLKQTSMHLWEILFKVVDNATFSDTQIRQLAEYPLTRYNELLEIYRSIENTPGGEYGRRWVDVYSQKITTINNMISSHSSN